MSLRPGGTLMQPRQVRSAARVTPTCSHRAARGTIKKTMETKVVPELPKRKEVPVVGEHLRRLALQPVIVPLLRHPKSASLGTTARSPGSSWIPLKKLWKSMHFWCEPGSHQKPCKSKYFCDFVTFGCGEMCGLLLQWVIWVPLPRNLLQH